MTDLPNQSVEPTSPRVCVFFFMDCLSVQVALGRSLSGAVAHFGRSTY